MKRRIEVQPDMQNVLALQSPQSYQCRVIGYTRERSLLVISVTHDNENLYVVFPDVHHFDGSFLWQGASLRVASHEEQFEYMLERSIVAALGMLFIFDGTDCRVFVLGGEWIAVLDTLPDRFK